MARLSAVSSDSIVATVLQANSSPGRATEQMSQAPDIHGSYAGMHTLAAQRVDRLSPAQGAQTSAEPTTRH